MYSYTWDAETGGLLLNSSPLSFSKEPRPVYYKELGIGIMQRMTPTPICGRKPTIISTGDGRLPRPKAAVFIPHLKL